jgi:hypothetical protein
VLLVLIHLLKELRVLELLQQAQVEQVLLQPVVGSVRQLVVFQQQPLQ